MNVTIKFNSDDSVTLNFKINDINIGEICIQDIADFNYDRFILFMKTESTMAMYYGDSYIKTINGKTIFGVKSNKADMLIECLNDECIDAIQKMGKFGWELYEKKLKKL